MASATEQLTWADVAEFVSKLSPQQLKQPVTLWDADNDECVIGQYMQINGLEGDQDIAPSDTEHGDIYIAHSM